MLVEIWSDVVCPWCYIGKRRFERALEQFEHCDDVEVVWRAFELDPNAPAIREGDYAKRIARKYGTSVEQAMVSIDRMVSSAAEDGIDMRFDLLRGGNTFDAHRLLHLALERGKQDALKERLMHATFTEGAPVGDHASLTRLAVEVGLDADEVAQVLESGAYGAEVRADETRGIEFDIHAVPFFVVDGRYGLPGAQPPEVLLRVLDHAWSERPAIEVIAAADACDDDECAL